MYPWRREERGLNNVRHELGARDEGPGSLEKSDFYFLYVGRYNQQKKPLKLYKCYFRVSSLIYF